MARREVFYLGPVNENLALEDIFGGFRSLLTIPAGCILGPTISYKPQPFNLKECIYFDNGNKVLAIHCDLRGAGTF